VETNEVMQALLELAEEVDLEIRILRARETGDSEFPPTSAFCRVKGRAWVVLSPRDPITFQLRVLGGALFSHAGAQLEDRYLPPALRQWIKGGNGPG
jgi:hypothetical protein